MAKFLREYYTLYVPVAFALLSAFVKLASRRQNDKSPHRNDLCIGHSMVLGSIAAALAVAVNALLQMQGQTSIAIPRIINLSVGCIGISVICMLLAFMLAYIDRYHAWKVENEIDQRKLGMGLIFPNIVGLTSFVLVFLYTRPER